MRVDTFNFDLPDDNIALRPASPRDAARLLLVHPDRPLGDRIVRDLPDLLEPGDALVFNDTRVLPAQLTGTRERDGQVARLGVTLHLREAPDTWRAFVRGAKKVREGEWVRFGEASDALKAQVTAKSSGEIIFRFDRSGTELDAALAEFGVVPLPPYIAQRRPADERDAEDYQTIYANEAGAVAAPTAGLHFTPDLLGRLKARGIEQHFVTLARGGGHLFAGQGRRYRRPRDAL